MRKFIILSILSALFLSASLNSNALVVPVTEPVTEAIKNEAVKEWNSLTKKEKKERIKEVKKEIKNFKKEKRKGADPDTNTLLLVILAILLPPLAVYLHQGEINTKFWISLILTLLFWLPGVIYALIVILGGA
ncbi:MAG: YqaE/Pmp3 family membrane protein [Chitinophagaceae bacterium]|nr:YqaE/Pmp3 family membrane protein [Chitinophagaceae bacterium]